MIELRTLGAVDLRGHEGRPVGVILAQPKRLALLAYLASARPRGFHRRDTLLGLFWPELRTKNARAGLRKAVHILRRSLGADVVLGRGDDELGVADGVLSCDLVAFEHALAERRFSDALELYRGDFMSGFYVSGAPEFERWVEGERSRCRDQAAGAAWTLAEHSAAEEQDALAVQWARRAMQFTPTDEAAVRRLIVLLYGLGDRAAALHAYSEFSAQLEQEYGVRPSAETRKLVEIVKASGEVAREASRGPRPPSPPKRAF